jgi:formamidopyrimidine-DNA glycosylase
MPELPEVETIRRSLAPLVAGRELTRLTVDDQRWCAPIAPAELVAAVEGRTIERLARRGKYLIWTFAGEVHLLVHLRMTGTLLYDPAPDARYRRVRFDLDDGHHLLFCDPRRFGTGELAIGDEGLERFLAPRVGIEPLEDGFTVDHLRALAKGRRGPVKAFLLDQTKIAGVGNIYADEALHRARIHPLRPVGQLQRQQLEALRDAVVEVLNAGIDLGGSTIDDFRHPDGVQGAFQNEFLVHLRKGEPCLTCGHEVVKFVAGGRGTYACESCQKRPRARRRA